MPEPSATGCRVILTTFPSSAEADAAGTRLVALGLAACVSVIPDIRSHYVWEGKLEHGTESLAIVKTTAGCVAAAIDALRAAHPYSVPEIIALDVSAGFNPYLEWIRSNTGTPPAHTSS